MTDEQRALNFYRNSPSHVQSREQCKLLGSLALQLIEAKEVLKELVASDTPRSAELVERIQKILK